ncbi:MAG TPA: enoyl-CoA hydratase/isomerase family protein [Longimicrobiales bacterium]
MEFRYIDLRLDEELECATLLLDREPSNLLNIAMMEEINEALQSLRNAPWLEVLVVRGANGTFSEGIDLKDHGQKRVQRMLQVYLRIFETIRMLNVITIAAIEGRAWGAGFELALGCNLIVATETSSFALPQINHGLIPPVASAILPRIAPRRRAMEWILTGTQISARRLEHDGVVNRLFSVDAMDEPLAAFVAEITSKSGPVLQLAKRAQFEGYYSSFPEALQSIQSLYLRELMSLEDAREGPRAAREGRQPVWKNE